MKFILIMLALLILSLLLFVPVWSQKIKSGVTRINTIEKILIETGSMRMDKNTLNTQTKIISYGEVFDIGKNVITLTFPDFSLTFKGISKPTLLRRLYFQTVKRLARPMVGGPMLSGNISFEVSNSKGNTTQNQKLKVEDVPWGWSEFVVLGKTYIIQIVGNEFDNPQLPQYAVTEGNIDMARKLMEKSSFKTEFLRVYSIDIDDAKLKYPEREFFRPSSAEANETLSVLEIELKKNNYTEASKRNIQLVGQIVNGKKQIYAFMWTVGGPLDENISKNKYSPTKDYLTNMILDGGSQYIDAVVSLDKNSDYYSALVVSFDPHGES